MRKHKLQLIRLRQTINRRRLAQSSQRYPMSKHLTIMIALSALLLTACGRQIDVRPALPICPKPIVLPKSMTVMPKLPTWFPLPPQITLKSLVQQDKPQCASAQDKR